MSIPRLHLRTQGRNSRGAGPGLPSSLHGGISESTEKGNVAGKGLLTGEGIAAQELDVFADLPKVVQ